VLAGLAIDAGGYAACYGVMGALSLLSLAVGRRVQDRAPVKPTEPRRRGQSWELLALPGMRRLLFVNWLLSASWDVHSFAVPLLGHERGYSAGTIGLVLGSFTAAVTLVRFAVPVLAHRLSEVVVLRTAMLLTGAVFAVYPLAHTPWLMGLCAALLGLPLGVVQPMVMSTLHQLTPEHRHGEAIAVRSMAINLSSTLMPLAFGAAGAALGPGLLFWVMGGAVGAGSAAASGLRKAMASVQRPH
jgi:predicted MFS family arabinose efflux permease